MLKILIAEDEEPIANRFFRYVQALLAEAAKSTTKAVLNTAVMATLVSMGIPPGGVPEQGFPAHAVLPDLRRGDGGGIR